MNEALIAVCGLFGSCIGALVGLVIGIILVTIMQSWLYYRDYPRLGSKWWLIKDIWEDIRKFVKAR